MTLSCELPGRASPYRFTNFQSRNIVFDGVGTAVASLFPLARRVATINLQAEAMLYALSLSSSLINATALDTVGIFVGIDTAPLIDLSNMTGLFLSHITRQNSIVGLSTASSRSNALNFGEETAYKLSSGVNLALYACSANTADNELSAICSIYWTPAGR